MTMYDKLFKCVLILCLVFPQFDVAADFSTVHAGVWKDAPTGKCFQSIDEYLEAMYGSAFREDENIKSFEVGDAKGNVNLIWVLDVTPGVNITRVLFRAESPMRVCAILYAPLSSSISFRIERNGVLPQIATSKNTPPPGFPMAVVKFRLDRKTKYYLPDNCQMIVSQNKRNTVDCSLIFSE